jgi:dolichol-phosphate mannosyltransferase
VQVDIVIPVYNEEEALLAFHAQLALALQPLEHTFRIYYIDDGSTDQTPGLLEQLAKQDRRVIAVELSRNFGHQAALTAGLDLADGDLVITMDGDGQHPPALIAEMIALAGSGYDIVLTQRMPAQQEETFFKKRTASLFYQLINKIGDTQVTPGAADFRLLRKPVVSALRGMREYHRFLRGMIPWMGFRSVILPFQQPQRLAGRSKYSLKKMVRLATDAIFSFSLVPLYIGISAGVLFLFLALAEMIYVLSFWVTGRQSGLAPGWSSLMFMLLIVGGSLMIAIGFMGIYIGYIFQEVKRRPIYLIRQVQSSGGEALAERPAADPTAGADHA